MLQIRHLTLTHRKDLRVLTEDFSFVLNPGDKAVLIGEEGNGKSTILKWLCDPALIEPYCEWEGEKAGESGPIGYLAQDLSEREKAGSIYEFCAMSPDFFDLTPKELAAIARQLRFPAEEFYSDRPVGTLSGGERIKLQLGRLLFGQPPVLLLDEPSSDVDLETLLWLETFMNSYQGILLYISHDETLIENTANLILHIEHPREGKPPRCSAHRLSYREYVQQRESGIAYQTQQARKEREEYEKKMERYRRIQQSVEHDQAVVSRQEPGKARLLKKKMHTVLSMGRRFEREAENMTRLPEVEQAVFLRFPPEAELPAGKVVLDLHVPELLAGERRLSRDIRLRVMGGEKVGIAGPNGAGKTTLLRLAAAELLSRQDIRAAYMSQDYGETLPLEQTPVEYLTPDGSPEAATRARTYLGSIRYAREEMTHPIRELSGGQKAKLLLTRMMLEGVNVLVLDEPTRNFSPMSGPEVRRALADFRGSIVSVSHDRKFLTEVCDKLYAFTETGLQEIRKEELL